MRDFAFASSRKFIWDAQGYTKGDNDTMAMSYYPKEGNPLWEKYSTQAIVHTIEEYNKYTFTYPYPVAISVNGPVGGMEYPMICFNGPRPEKDGTYSTRSKYGLIGVIIHEVGHNYFPMIVNSDERQWTWMDEGLNTFLQFLAEQNWEENYPARRVGASKIVGYMKSKRQVPIMTNSESLLQFGNNAYAKPATALNVLRETILGRELFDFAFREYAQRWKFKRPQPADFFRTMEDASGVDLDWFWRGWFYSTEHVDIALTNVKRFQIDSKNPEVEKPWQKAKRDSAAKEITHDRNKGTPKRTDRYPELIDFYNTFDKLNVTPQDLDAYKGYLKKLDDDEKEMVLGKDNYYVLSFENKGGLVMPIIFEATFTDGSKKEYRIPAEIWRRNAKQVSKLIITDKEVLSVNLDPHLETADTNRDNNYFPQRIETSRFEIFKRKKRSKNPMQLKKKAEEKAKKKREKKRKK